MAEVILRPMVESDRAFILGTGWRSIREHAAAEDCTPGQLGGLLGPLLDSWGTTVAVDQEHPNVIYGWLCARPPYKVAWGFTQPHWRGKGLMRALMASAGVGKSFECVFPIAMRLSTLKPRWRPYLALGEK